MHYPGIPTMKFKKLLTRALLLGAVASMMSGCIVVPRGGYHYYDHDRGGWGHRGR